MDTEKVRELVEVCEKLASAYQKTNPAGFAYNQMLQEARKAIKAVREELKK